MNFMRPTVCQIDTPETRALLKVIDNLTTQNRELHDRIMALTAPVAMQQVGSQRLAEMEVRGMPLPGMLRDHVRSAAEAASAELPGTQVGETVEPMIDTSKE